MPLPRALKLRSADLVPLLGLGTWKSQPGEVGGAVRAALDLGIRHIDCAWIYGNEREIGTVLKDKVGTDFQRSELFVVSKLWPIFYGDPSRIVRAVEESVGNLGLDHLDALLLHWPFCYQYIGDKVTMPKDKATGAALFDEKWHIRDTWPELEKLVEQGKTRNIGVCNYGITRLEELLKVAKIKPAVNQVELHPYNPQPELVEFCKQEGIAVTAYSPLGSGGKPSLLEDPIILEVAKKLSLTPAQVLLSWGATRGTVVIPKSVKPERIKENMHLVELDKDSMEKINGISKRVRYVDPKPWQDAARKVWGTGLFD
ncbi:NADP-dependent oxidoreductase domain-containing protein [Hyaloraphidium curvatum]|nr:NADP-dependent oxidoreductase domain-containing protein [Hyaloraphidium curvatum]